ncbi:MAG: filamentous hemagglutinin N-terminal domain-containing protein [Verrucomicrobia bacterium]|nr:filamentous hemagglutinin N-terminal domain-containing protein [Leptolyngbya sp. ES-bin-22]
MRRVAREIQVLLAAIALSSAIGVDQVQAQIVPNPGDTGTTVSPVGNRFDIGGGKLSGDNANLFHSLSQFGLTQSQVANFLSNPSTRNILVRVTGGEASRLDGLIQVSGSNANLFLMNPTGIVFGASATLNVSGSFIATTANGIGFGANWFNASGTNNYEALVGNPGSYAFTVAQPGSIINAGSLTVGTGQQLALLGGTVVSSGGLAAPDGQIIVAAVPGQSIVRLSQPGSVLNLEIQRPTPTDRVEAWTLPVLSLPQLLTGGSGSNATGLTVNANGQVALTGSGVQIAPGDVAVRQATAAPGGTLFRATGSTLDATAFLQIQPLGSKPASRIVTPPPDQVLPTSPVLTSPPPDSTLPARPSPGGRLVLPPDPILPPTNLIVPPTRFLPRPSVRQPVPPNSTLPPVALPSVTAPDCGSACPTQTIPSSQPTRTQTSGNTGSTPIVNFQSPTNQPNPVVTLSDPLPQYSSQSTASQPSQVQINSTQSNVVQSNAVQVNFVQPGDSVLPIGVPDQNLSNGAIDAVNQESAVALRLEALKKYLQKRWKATPQLSSKLQYTLFLDGKGAIQQVVPVGQEAATYLADLKLPSVGQANARPAAQGLEVTVRLSPDGTVEVIPNSLTLRN